MQKKRPCILLKLTGEIFSHKESKKLLPDIISQIKHISTTHNLGIVLGGGNLFRGATDAKGLGIAQATAHELGMLATIMNGRMFQALLVQEGLDISLLSALPCPTIAAPIRQATIDDACRKNICLLFVGGTGNPFVTTDTTAVIRALQCDAQEIWKATKVAGVYDADPMKVKDATLLKHITFDEALQKNLGFMDQTALMLARSHQQRIRVFDVFAPGALKKALEDQSFGSSVAM